jgi:hypothetical protein
MIHVQLHFHLIKRVQETVCCSAKNTVFGWRQVDAVKGYVHAGGCVLLLSAQGGDARHKSNLNELLHDFGITINSDSLVCVYQLK